MRPSSSPSEAGRAGLFGGVFGRGKAAACVSDDAWLRAMLDVEAALARAGAKIGAVPQAAAEQIAAACAEVTAFDIGQLGQDAAAAGNPVVPLVRRIEELAGQDAGAYVHRGATSQDVIDTAMMLLARDSLDAVRDDLRRAADTASDLALRHRDDAVAGRTLLQQALPTTFGLKAAVWVAALDTVDERLRELAGTLPVQMFGAVGTMAAFDGRGIDLLDALAAELDLCVPVVAWHTMRLPVAELAGALGATAGVVHKVALDVTLHAQSEVGEVAEDRRGAGGSSTMPHKRNPIAAVSARAAAVRVPGLVATLLAAMAQEHERAAGAWHAEWPTLAELIACTGSAAAWLAESLEHLVVDTDRMAANLSRAAGALHAERLAQELAGTLGRAAAHDRVAAAVRTADAEGRALAEVLTDDPGIPDAVVRSLRDPTAPDTGEAGALVDRALSAHRAVRGLS
jgi:3-carboxy-cis,cis-muconate cycloisomerase